MGQTAVRSGEWKAIQAKAGAAWELYDLRTDVSESKNLAQAQPDVLARLQAHAKAAHRPVAEGTFASTALHERDRAAKFGGNPPPPKAPGASRPRRARRRNRNPDTLTPSQNGTFSGLAYRACAREIIGAKCGGTAA